LADGSDEHGLPDDIVLVVSELVTNADRHGGGPEWLALSASWGDSIRVEVADLSRRLPAMLQPPAPARPEGHGLRLVQRAADRVGVELWRHRPGKSVWAEFHWIHRLHRIHGIAAEGGPEPPDVATAG
jgi:anti-sigma regulatory factor (Ser/Thr protein kinase)